MIEAFLKAPETSNARDVEHAHQSEIEYVPVDDPLVALNVDTPEEYAALALGQQTHFSMSCPVIAKQGTPSHP